jgi:uncharacterized membrane protein (TIGR02234 family)
MSGLTKGRLALVAALAAVAVIAAAGGTWVTGIAEDGVLGTSAVSAEGSVAAPGLVGLALVVLAAVIAAMVTGTVVRRLVLGAGVLAALGALALSLRAVLTPEAVLGPVAASTVGRSGSLPVEAEATGWAIAGAVAAAVMALITLLALVSSSRWPAPTRKYERAGEDGTTDSPAATGQRGERVRSDWEALSEGHDPTDVPPGRDT